MKKIAAGFVFVSFSMFAQLGFAEEHGSAYIGGNFGLTSIDAGSTLQKLVNDVVALGYSSASASMDQKSTGYKIYLGRRLNPNIAIEGFWAKLGTYNYTLFTTGPILSGSGDVQLTAIGADILFMFSPHRSQSGYFRMGFYQADAKSSFSVTGGPSASASDTSSNLKFGLGNEVAISDSTNFRFDWEYYNDSDVPINILSVGLNSHF
jgi:OOP family OmpA-OmpF porin